MAVILPNSVMIHVPKTGGSWCRTAIKKAGIKHKELNTHKGKGCRHEGISQIRKQIGNRFTFGFVRNPITWMQSRWAYSMRNTQGEGDGTLLWSGDFNTWVMNVLERQPTFVLDKTLRLVGYTCKDGEWVVRQQLGFIGKTENLTDDLIQALTLAGESFDESIIRQIPPQKVCSRNQHWLPRCKYKPNVLKRVIETCSPMFEIFDYDIGA